MAQVHSVKLVDDLDGSKAAETVHFAFGGAAYEIDLSARNAARFRKVAGEYVPHARVVRGANGHPGTRAGRRLQRARNSEIRAWAKQRGIEISERGRIPAAVIASYNANS